MADSNSDENNKEATPPSVADPPPPAHQPPAQAVAAALPSPPLEQRPSIASSTTSETGSTDFRVEIAPKKYALVGDMLTARPATTQKTTLEETTVNLSSQSTEKPKVEKSIPPSTVVSVSKQETTATVDPLPPEQQQPAVAATPQSSAASQAATSAALVLQPNDVLLGRGKRTRPGNVKFQTLIEEKGAEYLVASTFLQKDRLVKDIRQKIGRFLSVVDGNYVMLDSKASRERILQSLRDKHKRSATPAKMQETDLNKNSEAKASSTPLPVSSGPVPSKNDSVQGKPPKATTPPPTLQPPGIASSPKEMSSLSAHAAVRVISPKKYSLVGDELKAARPRAKLRVETPKATTVQASQLQHDVVVLQRQQRDSSSYANRHIPAFLDLFTDHGHEKQVGSSRLIQTVMDGQQLTAQGFGFTAPTTSSSSSSSTTRSLSLQRPVRVLDTPQSIGMSLPSFCLFFHRDKKPFLSLLRSIAALIGPTMDVSVIDVSEQEEIDKKWTLLDLVEYFELECGEGGDDKDSAPQQQPHAPHESQDRSRPPPRSAALQARLTNQELTSTQRRRGKVLNQISLEFSSTELARHVRSPQVVRDLDWIDTVWPSHWRNERQTWPAVQYYCLTSAAGAYTDFHVDFGGTSVWYHVLVGQKKFCLIAPTAGNLMIYEKWLSSTDQSVTFLPDLIPRSEKNKTLVMTTLQAGQTMMIPSGWIHAVYTPVDSIVFGGNFLHGGSMRRQLQVYAIERRTRVLEKFRVPFFRQLHFYAGGVYLEKLRQGLVSRREVEELPALIEALSHWWEEARQKEEQHDQSYSSQEQPSPPKLETLPTVFSAAIEAASDSKSGESVTAFLDALRREVDRVAKQGIYPSPDLPKPQNADMVAKKAMTQHCTGESERVSTQAVASTTTESSKDTPTSHTRLRLKVPLSHSKEPSGRHLDLAAANDKVVTSRDEDTGDNESPFRISISAQPAPILVRPPQESTFGTSQRKGKRWRSDRVGRDSGDEEWTPGSRRPSKRRSTGSVDSAKRPSIGAPTLPPSRRPSAASTSRQRLLKHCR